MVNGTYVPGTLPFMLGAVSTPKKPMYVFLGEMYEVRLSRTARYDADFTPVRRFAPDRATMALYHFDEGQGTELKDSSGNGHHGVIMNATWIPAFDSPQEGPSEPIPPGIELAGSGSVEFGNLHIDLNQPVTIEAFVTSTQLPVKSKEYFIASSSTWYFGIDSNHFWETNLWSSTINAKSQAVARVRTPTHIAAVLADKKLRLFINGKLNAETILKTDPPANTAQTKYAIGYGKSSFHGVLSEIRVSSVARYNNDFTPAARHEPDTDTMALYHCDEGEGDVLTDSSGHERHGTIKGATWSK